MTLACIKCNRENTYRSVFQSFDDEFKSTATSDADKVISGFPAFTTGNTSANLGYLAYNGAFAGWLSKAAGRYTIGVLACMVF